MTILIILGILLLIIISIIIISLIIMVLNIVLEYNELHTTLFPEDAFIYKISA